MILYSKSTLGAAVNSLSCNSVDVQNAINQAVSGDTVLIPSGNCTWNSNVTIPKTKALTIRGAGIDSTNITISGGTPPITLNAPTSTSGVTTFSGMTFTLPSSLPIYWNGVFIITTDVARTGPNFRVHDVKVVDEGRKQIFFLILNDAYGLIDNCQFFHLDEGVQLRGSGASSWAAQNTLGTNQALFVEDCLFDYSDGGGSNAIDAYGGARYVFRYNTLIRCVHGHHGLDTGGYRGTMQFEVYNNNVSGISSGAGFAWCGSARSGSGVVFNNACTITGSFGYFALRNYRSGPDEGDMACGKMTDGCCDGTNPVDGNTLPLTDFYGWPCKDQIGRGQNQTLLPLYLWGNTVNGSPSGAFLATGGRTAFHLVEGRDYFHTPKPGYVPYEYPHPLRLAPTAPGAPKNLRILPPK